jgi:hypothetical protein
MAGSPPVTRNAEIDPGDNDPPKTTQGVMTPLTPLHSLSLADFITNIAESDFRYTQVPSAQAALAAGALVAYRVFCAACVTT